MSIQLIEEKKNKFILQLSIGLAAQAILFTIVWASLKVIPAMISTMALAIYFIGSLYFRSKNFSTKFRANYFLVGGYMFIFVFQLLYQSQFHAIYIWAIFVPLIIVIFCNGENIVGWLIAASLLGFSPLLDSYGILPKMESPLHFDSKTIIWVEAITWVSVLSTLYLLLMFYKSIQDIMLSVFESQRDIVEFQKNELVQSQSYRNRFFASISHELRTPMNAIIGISELLSNKDSQNQAELMRSLKNSSNHLLTIINDILDLSKLQENKLEIAAINFDLREMLYAAYNIVKHSAIEKQIDVSFHVDANLPKYVSGDPHRITQVIVNLLSNAIKFTDKGFVKLLCKCENDCDATSTFCLLKVEVIDSGIGIPEDMQDKIFDGYIQANPSIAGKYGGTGLGLNISQRLISLMGGNLEFVSKPNEGAKFYFTINLPVAHDSTLSINKNKTFEIEYPLRILIVDDNTLNLMVAQKLLEKSIKNVFIRTAVDGYDAIEKLKMETYDLVMMDLQMPNLNGIDTAKIIRTELKALLGNIVIMAVSANVGQSEIAECYEAGMDDYVTKPFEVNSLLLKIDSYKERYPSYFNRFLM